MTQRTLIYFLFLLAGAALGAVARGAIGVDPPESPVAVTAGAPRAVNADLSRARKGDNAAVVDMLESLSYALTQEAEYRQTLEERLTELSDSVEELKARLGEDAQAPNPEQRKAADLRRGGALTIERLVEAGLEERDARNVKRRVDDIAMQRLYLRDEAMRDGWLGSDRYRQASRELVLAEANLASDFGEDVYDRYLYASGRPNRVQIQSVIGDSPAATAGLQTGDQIVSYNGQRAWGPGELRRASQQGTAGEMIALDVRRGGRALTLYIPRGPLGIQMTGVSEKP